MENQYTPRSDEIAKMLRKESKDTIYYFFSMIGITIIPIILYISN